MHAQKSSRGGQRSSGKESIQVVVRIRPEKNGTYLTALRKKNQVQLICPSSYECEEYMNFSLREKDVHSKVKNFAHHDTKCFNYDMVLGPETSQQETYEKTGRMVIKNCIEGYNSCIFAYGQTGSGKTHTMFGPNLDYLENRGIVPRLVEELFSTVEGLKKQEKNRSYQFFGSMCEIYNEKIKDLLVRDTGNNFFDENKKNLEIRKQKVGWNVKGLTEKEVFSSSQMLKLIKRGLKRRTTAKTRMNEYSSRSHTIFQLKFVSVQKRIEEENRKEDDFDNFNDLQLEFSSKRVSLVNLVDIAGSEQMSTSLSYKDQYDYRSYDNEKRDKELISINLSLSTLGLVINKLARKFQGDKSVSHIPYRDSKLTKILHDSLGGNSKTIMIATISASPQNYYESLSTCRFADRVKSVRNKPLVNINKKDLIIRNLKKKIRSIKKQNDSYSVVEMKRLKYENTILVDAIEKMKIQMEKERKMMLEENKKLKNVIVKIVKKQAGKINEINKSYTSGSKRLDSIKEKIRDMNAPKPVQSFSNSKLGQNNLSDNESDNENDQKQIRDDESNCDDFVKINSSLIELEKRVYKICSNANNKLKNIVL